MNPELHIKFDLVLQLRRSATRSLKYPIIPLLPNRPDDAHEERVETALAFTRLQASQVFPPSVYRRLSLKRASIVHPGQYVPPNDFCKAAADEHVVSCFRLFIA